jgi:phosphatidylinositol alpha-mannosyltransferase
MRIVQVCPYNWDTNGGVQIHVRQLAQELRGRGHEVLIVAPGDVVGVREDAHVVGRTLTVLSNGSVARICLSPRARRTMHASIARFAPDLVHIHEPFAPMLSVSATMGATVPVVGTFHSYFDPRRLEGRIYGAMAPLLRRVWDRVDRRIAVSGAARLSATSRLGDAPMDIVPNGAEVRHFARARPATHLPTGRKLLFVGRLEPRKGFPIAVRAFAQLAEQYPDLQLVVVGDGPEKHAVDVLSPALRARVQMLGKVTYDALPTYHQAADIFISPATGSESFGIVLVEAMAAGLPLVASDIAGYREVSRHGKEGLLVKPSDPHALADGVRTLLDNPTYARTLGANGATRAQDFAWDRILDQLEVVYEGLVPEKALAVL